MHLRAVSSCVFVLGVCGCGAPEHAAPAAAASLDGSVSSGSGYPVASSPDAAVAEDAGGGSSSGAGAEAGGPSPSCSTTPVWGPGASQTISIAYGDAGLRSYDVYVGTGVTAGAAVPLLVNMHGWTNTPALQAQFSQMNPVADANGFVVVYPAGLDESFNAGECCGVSATDAGRLHRRGTHADDGGGVLLLGVVAVQRGRSRLVLHAAGGDALSAGRVGAGHLAVSVAVRAAVSGQSSAASESG